MFFPVDEVDAFGQAVGCGGLAAHLDAVQAIDVESLTVLSGLHAGDACFDSVQAEVQGIHFRAAYGEIGSCAAQCTARSATHDVLRTVLLGHAVKAFHVPACFIIAGEGYVAVGYGFGYGYRSVNVLQANVFRFFCEVYQVWDIRLHGRYLFKSQRVPVEGGEGLCLFCAKSFRCGGEGRQMLCHPVANERARLASVAVKA